MDKRLMLSQQRCLVDVLKDIGPLPQEALLMGLCSDDDLPILHNLAQNNGKPFLVCAPKGWGKTEFLKMVFCASLAVMGREVAAVILTDQPDEWADLSHVVTVAEIKSGSMRLALDCAVGLASRATRNQFVLLFVDGWHSVDPDHQQILSRLKIQQICTIITSETDVDHGFVQIWNGNRPGTFITLEKHRTTPVQFYAPRL